MPLPKTVEPPARIQIQEVWPQLDCGRYPVKRTLGDPVEVWADIFRDGHEILRADVKYRRVGARRWQRAPMEHTNADRWTARFEPSELGRWQFTIEAWVDRAASWRHELERKVEAGQDDLAGVLSEGAALLDLDALTVEEGLADTTADRSEVTERKPLLEVDVDRERARFGAWYELFPRSWGGLAGVERVLPELADLGFDVLYLPPIHPIGRTNRKGRNNAPVAAPGDPGSPWAIGSDDGGHTALEPGLGTLRDFDRLVAAAAELGLELALDFAIQCSPDHPWLTEHPEWFYRRPDGTLKYAENPPKRYQDIYNVNFACEDWRRLWKALRGVVLHWVEHGVRIFRVDNPHTKPLAFWEWLIHDVRGKHPDVVFLAEAFTRPVRMAALAKIGFSQSYTYFTWKNAKWELEQYMTELTQSALPEFFRPNFFANTPDILHEYLQRGGRPAFEARLVLAATLSPSYGIYSGYEAAENVPLARGQRGVPRLREVRAQGTRARRRAAAARQDAEHDPARASGTAAARQPDVPGDAERRADRLCEAGGRRHGRGRCEPRPDPRAGRPRLRARRTRLAAALRRHRPPLRECLPRGPRPATTCGSIPAARTCSAWRADDVGDREDAERIVSRDHHDPHSFLGAHPGDGGVVVRAFRPGAQAVRVRPDGGSSTRLRRVHREGLYEGLVRGVELPLAYRVDASYPGGSTWSARDPYSFPPTLGALDVHLAGGRAARATVRASRRAPTRGRRHDGHGLRGVGAFGAIGLGRRGLQRLERAPPSDALARRLGHLGAVRPRAGAGCAVQVRDPYPGRRSRAEGRPGRVPCRSAAADGIRRRQLALRVG